MKDGIQCKEEEGKEEGLPGKIALGMVNYSLIIRTETEVESWKGEGEGGQLHRHQLQS
jgi:hypothetical protein